FKLYDKEEAFAFYSHTDPGTHNYQLDNRQHSYAFFTKHFNRPVVESEIPVDDQVRSYAELSVGIPKDNLTILGLARKLVGEKKRPPIPTTGASKAQRARAARERRRTGVPYVPDRNTH